MHLINQRVTDEWKMWREFRSMHCVYQLHVSINVLRLIICRFQSHLLLLVYKLYSLFFFCFGFKNTSENILACVV